MVLGYHFKILKSIWQTKMDPTTLKIRHQLDRIVSYLTPLLPIANCHMVEFFTDSHWETLIPEPLRRNLDDLNMDEAVDKFWKVANDCQNSEINDLSDFIKTARAHCITIDNEVCLSVDAFKQRIQERGGDIKPEIRVTEFMSYKKGYEVQTMSQLVASLFNSCGLTHCVDIGGGRGQLPTVLALGYNVRGLTVDCDRVALGSGMKRDRLIQKQWHAISKKITTNNTESDNKSSDDAATLHRYVEAFVTKDTDLCELIKNNFPVHSSEDIRLLLTGLHTCGNLGPSSLRIFTQQAAARATLNVPCCYHLLSEPVDGSTLWNGFEEYHGSEGEEGFPMSEFLRGYRLGRNARMLAAQSIDRVVLLKQLPSRSLFYRALLQVVIKEHLPASSVGEGKLKRVSQKSDNFHEYFKAADAILKLNLFDSLSDSYLTELYKRFDIKFKNLVLFYLLRLCLAQVIESVILLDRLLYLKENGFKNAFLVKLFDPVLSPRCHAIVSVK